MRRLAVITIVYLGCVGAWTWPAKLRGAAATDWVTSNGDAQRSAVVGRMRRFPKTHAKPGFRFLWKLKLKNEPRQLNSSLRPRRSNV